MPHPNKPLKQVSICKSVMWQLQLMILSMYDWKNKGG